MPRIEKCCMAIAPFWLMMNQSRNQTTPSLSYIAV